jgi:hypothetical protein
VELTKVWPSGPLPLTPLVPLAAAPLVFPLALPLDSAALQVAHMIAIEWESDEVKKRTGERTAI